LDEGFFAIAQEKSSLHPAISEAFASIPLRQDAFVF
jgi:hypothetical protein